jgi:hypothetical protein
MTAHNKYTPKTTKSKIILPQKPYTKLLPNKKKTLKTPTEQTKSIQSFTIK